MINEGIQNTIRTLFEAGNKKKEIARYLKITVKTVRKVLGKQPETARLRRSDKKDVNYDVLKEVYERCDGYVQRVYEVLGEEYDITIGYSTLTRLIRELDIGQKRAKRAMQFPDVPGEEMQHDTSVYNLIIGGKKRKVVCSGLYLRYSKMRYIRFYPHFNRFTMKCFFHEALCFWGYSAKICLIDNTNLAVWYGTGAQARFSPEMRAFAASYGFTWLAHRIGHANRKAGKERNFYTLETNFFPGRSFASFQDLNNQALQWATERYAHRPLSVTRLIPIELFRQEKPYLLKLPNYIKPPYQEHARNIDQYGYVAFKANYYWVPESTSSTKTMLIEYQNQIHIYQNHTKLIEYPLPDYEVKNKKFFPPGMKKSWEPRSIKKGCQEEEKRLRALGERLCEYLDYVQSSSSEVKQRPRFIRDLYALSKKMDRSLFLKCIERAAQYKIADINSLERIASLHLRMENSEFPQIAVTQDFEEREMYQKGRFSCEADLKHYRDMFNKPGNQ